MSCFYVFELPDKVVEGLKPFKLDFLDSAATPNSNEHDSDSHSDSHSDSQSDSDLSSDSDNSEASSSDTDSPSENSVDKPKPAKKSTFSSAVTKYLDGDDELSIEQWQWANQAHITGTPFVYFSNPSVFPEKKVLSIYKSWFDNTRLIDSPVQEVRSLPKEGKSCILMVGSGNFAGAIFDHHKHHHKTNISNPFANVIVLASKTFHRYTTRRKQGGAQSASDSARGKANSAGSTIRRANERMLQEEIKELLRSWAPHLKDCHRIFIRAAGRSNRQLLIGYPEAPIEKGDSRVVQLPFAMGRFTLNECKSAWLRLTQTQVVDPPEPPLAPSVPSSKQESPAPAKPKSKSPEPVKEITAEEQLSSKIVDLIKRSKLPALKLIIEKEANGSFDFELQPASKFFLYPTPLLYAAHFDKHNVVSQLLKWGASPMITNEQGQTVGELASPHLKTMEALQITRQALGEQKWDWKTAKVGPPLTREQILQKDMQKKLRIKKEHEELLLAQEKKEKSQRIERLISKHGSGKLTGGLYEASRGMSEADLKHVERERRARAAEARLAKLGG